MNSKKNHRVYLVLDPDEAEIVDQQLSKGPAQPGSPIRKILSKLRDAMMRAKGKGAKLGIVIWKDRG